PLIPADSIVLEDACILDDSREVVRNGTDYLWTARTVRLRGVYSPLYTSYVQTNPPAAPVARAGFRGAATDAAIRHKLEQPRRQLYLELGPSIVLRSPRAGQTVDANNGPFCMVNSITPHGTKTYFVDLTFVTYVNECWNNVASPSVML